MAVPKHWMMGDAFSMKAKHHQSMEALWTRKWRFPCSLSVYPFHDGKLEDFEKVFDRLIKVRYPLDSNQNQPAKHNYRTVRMMRTVMRIQKPSSQCVTS